MKLLLLILVSATTVFASSYSTNFPLTENPISENGQWINGSAGIDWYDVQTVGGWASGAMPWSGYPNYTDPTAILKGNWGPDQYVQATVVQGNTWSSEGQEVELRLRTTIAPHAITGYEICFRNYPGLGYCDIVRWNGPLGDFRIISSGNSSYQGIKSGDVISATIIGSTISAYVNGTLVNQTTDNTFVTGSPGIGFCFFNSGSGNPPAADQKNFGLTAFSATDNSSTPSPTPSPNPSPTPAPHGRKPRA
jgi:hypothetical protein